MSLICELMEMNIYELIQGATSRKSNAVCIQLRKSKTWMNFGLQDEERPCPTTQ